MTACLRLRDFFKNDEDFAWRLLEAECEVHIKRDVGITDITKLSQLYMSAVERLNSAQDQREKYFNQCMLELMAKPFVIRCFNNENVGKRNDMQFKRKEIQEILFYQNEKASPERLNYMINQYDEKEKKVKERIDKIMEEHELNLEKRLRKRTHLRHSSCINFLQEQELSQNLKGSEVRDIKVGPFKPTNSRTTIGSQSIQLNSP